MIQTRNGGSDIKTLNTGSAVAAVTTGVGRRRNRKANTAAPQMPCVPASMKHRPKMDRTYYGILACVARPVSKIELEANPKAVKARDEEWRKLRAKDVWDESVVMEWNDARGIASRAGETIHLARLFGICVEKGSELSDPKDIR